MPVLLVDSAGTAEDRLRVLGQFGVVWVGVHLAKEGEGYRVHFHVMVDVDAMYGPPIKTVARLRLAEALLDAEQEVRRRLEGRKEGAPLC